ncbi:hypothetical protein CHU67_00345 [Corynebacterium sp. LK19]|uniref:hypothetical protein n=1 Tax=Corynebacterium sp. LK19 TaxID=2022660 RepID=UPI0011CB5FE6|nr:hypothetical protein [Corynebacterium sp. LK19]TXS60878.1 hypothetical protein CHU67_00345 [Corynebacterium sp. LK19]
MKITISRITSHEDGKHFTIHETGETPGETVKTSYRTDGNGEGLWFLNHYPDGNGDTFTDWVQLLGSAQFNLNGSSTTNRQQIAWYALKDEPAFEQWADNIGHPMTPAAAAEYAKTHPLT